MEYSLFCEKPDPPVAIWAIRGLLDLVWLSGCFQPLAKGLCNAPCFFWFADDGRANLELGKDWRVFALACPCAMDWAVVLDLEQVRVNAIDVKTRGLCEMENGWYGVHSRMIPKMMAMMVMLMATGCHGCLWLRPCGSSSIICASPHSAGIP